MQAAGAGRPAGRLGASLPSSSPDFQSLGAGPLITVLLSERRRDDPGPEVGCATISASDRLVRL